MHEMERESFDIDEMLRQNDYLSLAQMNQRWKISRNYRKVNVDDHASLDSTNKARLPLDPSMKRFCARFPQNILDIFTSDNKKYFPLEMSEMPVDARDRYRDHDKVVMSGGSLCEEHDVPSLSPRGMVAETNDATGKRQHVSHSVTHLDTHEEEHMTDAHTLHGTQCCGDELSMGTDNTTDVSQHSCHSVDTHHGDMPLDAHDEASSADLGGNVSDEDMEDMYIDDPISALDTLIAPTQKWVMPDERRDHSMEVREDEDDAISDEALSEMMVIRKDDITTMRVDAIVNAANKSLLGGEGVDGVIHKAAGPKLLIACRKLNGCEVGKAKVTKAFRLPAKHVIHAVGPNLTVKGHPGERERLQLTSAYTSSLDIARERQMKTIAFPCISAGIYGYPMAEACRVALTTTRDWLKRNEGCLDTVYFCVFDEKALCIYGDRLRSLLHQR